MSAILKQKLIDIANGFTKYGLWKDGTEITVDSELSTTSKNPVQNKVITENLNDKVIIKRSNGVSVDIPVNSSVLVGIINDLITIPNGYSIATIMPYSTSNGNCIPFVRVNESTNALEIHARNFYIGPISTKIYVRVILVKN